MYPTHARIVHICIYDICSFKTLYSYIHMYIISYIVSLKWKLCRIHHSYHNANKSIHKNQLNFFSLFFFWLSVFLFLVAFACVDKNFNCVFTAICVCVSTSSPHKSFVFKQIFMQYLNVLHTLLILCAMWVRRLVRVGLTER